MEEEEEDSRPTRSSKRSSASWLPEVPGLRTAIARLLPALMMGVFACFMPPSTQMGWLALAVIALLAVALNKPSDKKCA